MLQCTEEAVGLVLQVCIPMLDEGVPDDWTVSLIDNPGFGEMKENITRLADASMVFSSAYIYLLQLGNLGGTEVAKFFTELDKLDRGRYCGAPQFWKPLVDSLVSSLSSQ